MLSMDKRSLKGLSSSGGTASEGHVELGRAFTREELLDQKRQSKLQSETKEMERSHLKKPIQRKGFIRFADYESKLKMMDTALFLFGLKLHK